VRLAIPVFSLLFFGCTKTLDDGCYELYYHPVTAYKKPTKTASFQEVKEKEMNRKCEELTKSGWTLLGSAMLEGGVRVPSWMIVNLARNKGGDLVLGSCEFVGYGDDVEKVPIGSTAGRTVTINNYSTGVIQGNNSYNPYYNTSANYRGTTTSSVYIPGETIYRDHYYKVPVYRNRAAVFARGTPTTKVKQSFSQSTP